VRLAPQPRIPRKGTVVGHVSGLVLLVAAAGMLAAGAYEAVTRGEAVAALAGSGIGVGLVGFALYRLTTTPERVTTGAVHAAVLISWVGMSFVATIPYLYAGVFDSLELAWFESVSGFTTTGATVLRPIEGTPDGILLWRAITQWIGGIGVIVFAVAVLPYLSVGGMELLEAEAPGPSSERLVPRVRETAKRLVGLYVGFTIVVVVLYDLFGMGLFDAVAHAFTTVSTGGFSPYNRSFAHFGSAPLEWVSIAAMIFAGGNFALWWRAIRGRPLVVLRAPEFHAYLALIALVAGSAVAWNVAEEGFGHDIVRRTIFSVVSLSSSTGYTDLDYDQWSGAVKLLLIFAMGLGGMAGSTTGGFKVFRLLAVLGYARRQIFRQLHPRAVRHVRIGRDIVPEDIMARVVGFFALFIAIGGTAAFLVAATSGLDPVSAISSVATSIGNVGPGMGEVGPTTDYLGLHPAGRVILVIVMLMGRLEIFPVLLGTLALVQWLDRRWRLAISVARGRRRR
jgi:trk system potassium uptake protein TrkH